jgi:hypothetical protein
MVILEEILKIPKTPTNRCSNIKVNNLIDKNLVLLDL